MMTVMMIMAMMTVIMIMVMMMTMKMAIMMITIIMFASKKMMETLMIKRTIMLDIR